MRIRPEDPSDFDRIDEVVGAAFATDPNVVPLVHAIRASDSYVPDLTLVAELNDKVVGHIMLSSANYADEHVLILSPLSVSPDHQRRGIGVALTNEALERARSLARPWVFVEGIPAYYPRFSFERASTFGIEPPNTSTPDEAFMVLRLDASSPPAGRFRYPPAFDVVSPT